MFKYLVAALMAAPSILAQAKVGTTGAQFLELPPSVRAIGMGDASVTLTSDRSYFYNPGSLGLLDCPRIQIAGSPLPTEYPGGVDYYTYSIAGKLKKANPGSRLSLAVAYHIVWLNSDTIVEQTYEGPGHTFSFRDYAHKVTVGAAYVGSVEFGIGGNIGYISEEANDEIVTDGITFDYGLLIRIPLGNVLAADDSLSALHHCRIDVGFSVCNLGKDLTILDRSYPLAVEKRGGIGVNATVGPFRLYPAVQFTHDRDDFTSTHLGFELEWEQAIAGRTGRMDDNDYDDNDRASWGLTVKARGLYESLTGKKWRMPLDLNLSYAWVEGMMTGLPGIDYYGFELSL